MYASLIFSVLYGTNKILRAIVLLFNSNFYQSFGCNGNTISFQSYWLIKGLISDILSGLFLFFVFFHYLMQWLNHIESNYRHYFVDFLLLFYFSTIFENLYLIRLFPDLFSEYGNTINQHFQKQINLLSLIFLVLLDIFAKEI